MALDGITVSNIVYELNNKLLNGRVDKIYQPLADEIIMAVRCGGENHRLLLTANPSHARAHLTKLQKENPISAPMFCMVLRKHISGGKITSVTQPSFERIINIKIESLNEMGDLAEKTLIIEIMGKHSNIILLDESGKILDSIKRITHETSSVREVLPQKEYCLPPSQGKLDPLAVDEESFVSVISSKQGIRLQEAVYKSFTGISPISASEICSRAGLAPDAPLSGPDSIKKLYGAFSGIVEAIKSGSYSPEIIYSPDGLPTEFAPLELTMLASSRKKKFSEISPLLEEYFAERDGIYHLRQRAADLRKLISTNIERCVKKKDIQLKTLKDTEKKDAWRIKGELLTANIYAVPAGAKVFTAANFYSEENEEIKITLDPQKTPSENAQSYFNKYNKAKRTLDALEVQTRENDRELLYLESVLNALESSRDAQDITEIRAELAESGYIKRRADKKAKDKRPKKSKPMHYISSDGLDIFVGKSNIQNDELTLRTASRTDMWLHTKNIPGSHVIIKMPESGVLPDATLLEAATLAALNSRAREGSNVPVDYTLQRNVKKPSGAKPGMVIYEHNKTIYVTPAKLDLKEA